MERSDGIGDALMALSESGEGRIAKVEFTGTRSELFGLLARGYLLMLPTLGIYRFWVTTAKRRFYWQNTVLDGDPLEYTGTAMQLLIGFLFALAVFLPIYIAFFYFSTQSPDVALIGYAIVGIVLWFLGGYAIYRARDFRLSRTLWRGIRFNQKGSAWVYAVRRFLWSIAMVVTLGLVYPFMAGDLWRYRYIHSWYGDRQFGWSGSWKTIAGPYYKIYALLALGVVGIVMLALPSGGADEPGFAIRAPDPAGILAFTLAVIAWCVVAFLAWFYFRSREATRMFSQVSIGEARARVRVRARALFGQFVIYCLALIGASLVFMLAAGALFGGIFTEAMVDAANGGGDAAVDLAQLMQQSWLTVAGLILAYLIVLATFALFGEVFLGFGYWMLVARGATITNADSLRSVRASNEDRSLAGEGLADALNVGAY